MNKVYKVTNTAGNFALLVADEYNEENYTITAFNNEGNLVADKLFGAQPRMINNRNK